MTTTRRRAELALTLLALSLLVGIGAQWTLGAPPWGYWTWTRALPLGVAGLLPWLLLGWLTLRRDHHIPWLALGASAASLPLGLSTYSLFVYGLYDSEALHRLARLTPLIAALALIGAQQLRGESSGWRPRVSHVALGALLVWAPVYLYLPIDGFFWSDNSWWHAPGSLLALVPVVVGVGGLLRGRTWGLVPLALAVPLTFTVVVPEARYSCFGPQGHPFAYGWTREFVAGCAVLSVAPWVRPALHYLAAPLR